MRTANRFQRGSGCFTCGVCKRQTRDTGGDNTSLELCEECYEVAGIENSISDGYYETPEQLAKAEADIKRLDDQCRAKGGKI